MSADPPPPGRVALVCGAGAFPGEVIAALSSRGHDPVIVAIRGVADPGLDALGAHRLGLGEIGALLDLLRREGAGTLALVGAVARPDLSDLRVDWGAVRRLPDLARLFRGGDDGLLRGVVRLFEGEGLRVVGADALAPELLAPLGTVSACPLTDEMRAEVAVGLACLDALAPFDVGQSLVVRGTRVLGIEGPEGTDALLARAGSLRRGKGRAGLFVKAAKPGQERRVDLPAIGPATIEGAAAAGLAGVAVAAGELFIVERARAVARADALGLVLHGAARNGR